MSSLPFTSLCAWGRPHNTFQYFFLFPTLQGMVTYVVLLASLGKLRRGSIREQNNFKIIKILLPNSLLGGGGGPQSFSLLY